MQLPAAQLRAGAVQAIEVDGHDYVLWRGADGRVRSGPRYCPHLDHDLSEGRVAGDELVCPGHGWALDGEGNTYKRNEFGRVDPKGDVETLDVHEVGDIVRVQRALTHLEDVEPAKRHARAWVRYRPFSHGDRLSP